MTPPEISAAICKARAEAWRGAASLVTALLSTHEDAVPQAAIREVQDALLRRADTAEHNAATLAPTAGAAPAAPDVPAPVQLIFHGRSVVDDAPPPPAAAPSIGPGLTRAEAPVTLAPEAPARLSPAGVRERALQLLQARSPDPLCAHALAEDAGVSLQSAANALSDLRLREHAALVRATDDLRARYPGVRVAYVLPHHAPAEAAEPPSQPPQSAPRRWVGALDTRVPGEDLRTPAERETILAWARANKVALPDAGDTKGGWLNRAIPAINRKRVDLGLPAFRLITTIRDTSRAEAEAMHRAGQVGSPTPHAKPAQGAA